MDMLTEGWLLAIIPVTTSIRTSEAPRQAWG